MATIAPTTSIVQEAVGQYCYTFTWSNMQAGDVGAPIAVGNAMQGVDHQLSYSGTYDSSTTDLYWEGSADGGSNLSCWTLERLTQGSTQASPGHGRHSFGRM
jgi:hypothetical protein